MSLPKKIRQLETWYKLAYVYTTQESVVIHILNRVIEISIPEFLECDIDQLIQKGTYNNV